MSVVLVVRIADDEGAAPKVLLRDAKPLVVAVWVRVDGHVGVAVKLVDVPLEVE